MADVTECVGSNVCKVCGGEKPDNPNVSFCSACKKFFLRNRTKLAVTKCTTGLRNCPISSNNRRLCSYCRLAKCFAIGIRGRGRIRLSELGSSSEQNSRSPPKTDISDDQVNSDSISGSLDTSSERISSTTSLNGDEQQLESPNNNNQIVKQQPPTQLNLHGNTAVKKPSSAFPTTQTSLLLLEKPPTLFDGAVLEALLRTVIQSSTELHAMDHTPMRKAGIEIPDYKSLWSMIMKQMNVGLGIGVAYSSCWLDVGEIDENDMKPLVMTGLVPMGASYMALPGNRGASMFGVNDSYLTTFLSYFPDFQDGDKALKKLATIMSEWNPSFVEASFLLAYLFFNDKAPVRFPEKVAHIRSRLISIFRMYMLAHSSKDYAEFAFSRFVKASKLIEDVSDFVFGNVVKFAGKYPQLASCDNFFMQVFGAASPMTATAGLIQEISGNNNADVMSQNMYASANVANYNTMVEPSVMEIKHDESDFYPDESTYYQ